MTFVADETDENWPSSIAALRNAYAFVEFPDPSWLPILREEVTGGINFVNPRILPLASVRSWQDPPSWTCRQMESTAIECHHVTINGRYRVCFLVPAGDRVDWAEVRKWIRETCPGKPIKDTAHVCYLFDRINAESANDCYGDEPREKKAKK